MKEGVPKTDSTPGPPVGLHCAGKGAMCPLMDVKKWPILTHQGTLPLSGTVPAPCSRPGIVRETRGKETEIRDYQSSRTKARVNTLDPVSSGKEEVR